MFFDTRRFAFAAILEQNWRQIYDEYLGITAHLIDWCERELYGEGWKVFGLFNFPHGAPIPENIRRCPHTASLVQQHIPTHGAAGYSILRPRTRIQPHQGYQGDFLRCHLGLKVPPGDCALRVQDEVRHWEAGKAIIFDDRPIHEAWNLTDAERVVLLLDFVPPKPGEPASAIP